MTREPFLSSIKGIFTSAYIICEAKNKDYANDTDAFQNFKIFETIGVKVEQGIMMRILEKLIRVRNLTEREAQVKDESIKDTIIDIINYLAILLTYIESEKNATTGNDPKDKQVRKD